jgi:hypothetical protein
MTLNSTQPHWSSLKFEIKYANESRVTQTREILRLRCPATTENYRPDLSSERVPHINKSAKV